MFQISLDNYHGPFDLILDLLAKNKLSISEIKIIEIIEEFMEYINNNKFDKDLEGDFLLTASKLLEIKSKVLLKQEIENNEDDENSLIQSLEKYNEIKQLSKLLEERNNYYGNIYFKFPEEKYINQVLDISNLTVETFMNHILKKEETKKNYEIYKSKPIISIEEKIKKIENILIDNDTISFDNIIDNYNKDENVVSMLSILELAKLNKVLLHQENLFENIIIERKKNDY